MCNATKQGIILYACNKPDHHAGVHTCAWEQIDEQTGKLMLWETFW